MVGLTIVSRSATHLSLPFPPPRSRALGCAGGVVEVEHQDAVFDSWFEESDGAGRLDLMFLCKCIGPDHVAAVSPRGESGKAFGISRVQGLSPMARCSPSNSSNTASGFSSDSNDLRLRTITPRLLIDTYIRLPFRGGGEPLNSCQCLSILNCSCSIYVLYHKRQIVA